MKIIHKKEEPDVVVGIFHAGNEARTMSGQYREDALMEVAQRILGFDVVMMRHDHRRYCGKVANIEGDSVLLINPASSGRVVGTVDVVLKMEDGKVLEKQVSGVLTDVDKLEPSEEFMEKFAPQYKAVNDFVSEKVGTFTESITPWT